MPEVSMFATTAVRFSDREWRVVLKALGYMAGIDKIRVNEEDQQEAAALSRALLRIKLDALRDQTRITENALKEYP